MMATANPFRDDLSATLPAHAKTLGGATKDTRLASVRPGQRVRIVRIAQDDDLAAWLRAVGMHEGAEVTVLRRAPFGGPIHLRSSDGGEFALHRDLARCIVVASAARPSTPPSRPGSME